MTEFGSDRYLEKLNQAQAQARATQSNGPSAAAPAAASSASQFILPLRGSNLSELEEPPIKHGDQKRSEKRGFGFLRNKFHVKTSPVPAASSTEPCERRPSTAKRR